MWKRSILGAVLVFVSMSSATSFAAKGKVRKKRSIAETKELLRKLARRKHPVEIRPYTPKRYADHGLEDKLSAQGRRARGLYVTPYYLRRYGAKRTARMAKRGHLNAVVIDVKDDWGKVLWPSKVLLSQGVQHRLIRDPKAMLQAFHEAGIYVIVRLVCFKDNSLPYARPDLSVRFQPKGSRLFWAGAAWLDHYSQEVRDYLIDLALEWQAYGADEVQLDYIRFPKGKTATWGHWLHQKKDSPPRDQLVASFLDRLDRALKIPLSVDLYGLTTLVDGDPRGLGQSIEKMAHYVEAISPMMYAAGMTSYFRGGKMTERVVRIIQCGIWRARQKAPRIALRPWLQAYPDRVPFFGKEFVRQQVKAVGRGGADGFLFWNPRMTNGTAFAALRRLGKHYVEAFGTNTEQYKRHRPGKWCKVPGKGNVFDRVVKKPVRVRKKAAKRPHTKHLTPAPIASGAKGAPIPPPRVKAPLVPKD
ncbi:MAG: hypothetical protein JRH20_17795 [Deltaproteobacteria bacterium]|nr:hypothetical protein [Deltaproteobacteria bacterium]